MHFSRALISSGIGTALLSFASNALAQLSSTSSATSKGGTTSSLPNAGTGEITYVIFVFGVMLFVLGTIKFVKSYRS